ncbi:MAG: 4Fe-4S dicluster domain-containing protein [Deltaproteobacteria bacterium]|jgi:sulfhydrogenase subunit beta (sulfur reductase)|nr:4Fe-4S dicluster domain-containing protein [Deltaproteobacteria bacterium]
MRPYIFNKSNLSAYLKQLDTVFEVWIPVTENGITTFNLFNKQNDIDLGKIPRTSVKSFFLPQHELLMEYSASPDSIQLDECLPSKKRIIFGVKPCEGRAVKLNSQLLVPETKYQKQDLYFKANQQNTILIAYGCNQPGVGCFCRSTGGDPFGKTGLDAIVTDLGDRLLLETTGTEISNQLIPKNDLNEEATESDLTAAEQIKKNACKVLDERSEIKVSKENIHTVFDLEIWKETAMRCLNCGICTYLCPTCSCFDMMDYFEDGKGSQSRCWDSCMFSLFTQHSLGHNPRPSKKERVRQRFLHKLRYYPEHHNGEISCVGCGRCVLHCPVNIDIREIADRLSLNGGERG